MRCNLGILIRWGYGGCGFYFLDDTSVAQKKVDFIPILSRFCPTFFPLFYLLSSSVTALPCHLPQRGRSWFHPKLGPGRAGGSAGERRSKGAAGGRPEGARTEADFATTWADPWMILSPISVHTEIGPPEGRTWQVGKKVGQKRDKIGMKSTFYCATLVVSPPPRKILIRLTRSSSVTAFAVPLSPKGKVLVPTPNGARMRENLGCKYMKKLSITFPIEEDYGEEYG